MEPERVIRSALREIPTWQLREAYEAALAGKPSGIEVVEQNRPQALTFMREILWERGKGKTDIERAATHFGVPESEVTLEMVQHIKGIPRGSGLQSGGFTKADIEEAAVKAAELTGAKIAEEVAKQMGDEMLHHSPISAHCEAVLAKPPKCYDFRGIRSYVLCKAWDIMESEKRPRLPVGEAWREARVACQTD